MKKAARAARDIALNMFEGWDAGAALTNPCLEITKEQISAGVPQRILSLGKSLSNR
jgi:hypothetical protein